MLNSARWISSPVWPCGPGRVVAGPVSSRMGLLFAQSASACGWEKSRPCTASCSMFTAGPYLSVSHRVAPPARALPYARASVVRIADALYAGWLTHVLDHREESPG